MRNESENPKRGEGRNYWIAAGLGTGASFLIYAASRRQEEKSSPLKELASSQAQSSVSTTSTCQSPTHQKASPPGLSAIRCS